VWALPAALELPVEGLRLLLPVSALLFALCCVFPASIALMNVTLGILTGAVAFEALHRRRIDVLPGWEMPAAALLLYLLVGMAATAFALDPRLAQKAWSKDFHKMWCLLLLVTALAQDRFRAAWRPLAVGILPVCAAGALQAAFLHDHEGRLMRAHGAVHPVTFGGMLALYFVAAVPFALDEKPDGPPRRRALVFLALVGATLLLNQTRVAALSVAAGLAVLAACEPRLRRLWPWAVTAMAATIAAWELLPFKRPLIRPLAAIAHALIHGGPIGGNASSLGQRLLIWGAAWRMFLDHPWLGVGAGCFGDAFTKYSGGVVIDGQTVWGSAHNLLLHQLASRGLIGTLALGGVLAAFGVRVRRSPAALALFAAFLVFNIAEIGWETEQLATLWLFLTVWTTAAPAPDARGPLFISVRPRAWGGGSNTFAYNLIDWARRSGVALTDRLQEARRAIVVAHLADPAEVAAARARGCSIIHRVDEDFRWQSEEPSRKAKHERLRALNAHADITVFQSEFVRERAFPVLNPGRHSVILNGGDARAFRPGSAAGALVGHVTWSVAGKKRLDVLFEAIRANPDKRFLLVGRHSESEQPFASLPNAELIGRRPRFMLPYYLRRMGALFFPSEDDPCPNTVVEAMLCGVPVCYAESGGTAELVRDCGLPLARFQELWTNRLEYRRRCLARTDLDFAGVAERYLALS
jgi:O-antigen ligase